MYAARLSVLFLAVATIAAQRTWIVDEQFGPGADVRDIRLAVIIAADGDKILVRPGRYSGSNIVAKGLTIVGLAGAEVRPSLGEAGFAVIDLTALQRVSIRGFHIEQRLTGGDAGLYLRDNRGPVHMESITVGQVMYPGVQIESSDAVSLLDVHIAGGLPNALLLSSAIALTRCSTSPAPDTQLPGMEAGGCTLTFVECSLRGANATASSLLAPGIGLWLDGCTTVIGNGGGSTIAAGIGVGPRAIATSAIEFGPGTLTLDPAVALQPSHGGQAVRSFASGTLRRQFVPTLALDTAVDSNQLACLLRGRVADLALTLASAMVVPNPSPFGAVWVDLAAHVVVDVGTIGGTAERRVTLPRRATLGTPIALQSVLFDRAGLGVITPPLVITY